MVAKCNNHVPLYCELCSDVIETRRYRETFGARGPMSFVRGPMSFV